MNLDIINRLRTRIYHSAWFPLLFLLFIAEFFFIPEDKWHSNLFRVGLLLPFLLVFPWRQFAARLVTSPTLVIACLLITTLLLSLAWSEPAEAGMTDKMLLHGLYIAGFILIGSDILTRHPGYDARLFYWLGWRADNVRLYSEAVPAGRHAPLFIARLRVGGEAFVILPDLLSQVFFFDLEEGFGVLSLKT